MTEISKAFLTMVPTTMVDSRHALQLVDAEGRLIGNQVEVKLVQSALSGESLVTVTFQFDGRYVAWWQGESGG